MVKRRQQESAFYLGTSTNGDMISVNVMSSFILIYFLQNLKNSLVTKRTIGGATLGRPVDSWVAFGDRATIFQQHCIGWCAPFWQLIVRRAGLLLSQQDFEWRWSVPLFQCLTVLEFSFILFDLCLLITFFNFIMNYVPIVTFWIFTYHKIWILSIMFCFIWSYWIIYFLACL